MMEPVGDLRHSGVLEVPQLLIQVRTFRSREPQDSPAHLAQDRCLGCGTSRGVRGCILRVRSGQGLAWPQRLARTEVLDAVHGLRRRGCRSVGPLVLAILLLTSGRSGAPGWRFWLHGLKGVATHGGSPPRSEQKRGEVHGRSRQSDDVHNRMVQRLRFGDLGLCDMSCSLMGRNLGSDVLDWVESGRGADR